MRCTIDACHTLLGNNTVNTKRMILFYNDTISNRITTKNDDIYQQFKKIIIRSKIYNMLLSRYFLSSGLNISVCI